MPATILAATQHPFPNLDFLDSVKHLWEDGYWIYMVGSLVLAYLFQRRWKKLNQHVPTRLIEQVRLDIRREMRHEMSLISLENRTLEQRQWLNERRIEMLEAGYKAHGLPLPDPFVFVPKPEEKP